MAKRIEKLVHLKQLAVDAAESALVAARVAIANAEHVLRETEAVWGEAIRRGETARDFADLADADARARTLRQAVQRAEWTLIMKRREEEPRLLAVAAARTELRRFEIWGERTDATANAEATRVRRVAEDDLASRKRRAE